MLGHQRTAHSGRRFSAVWSSAGSTGCKLVISDAHEGIRKAVGMVLSGASWQRCRVHFMRNVLATVPHSAREPVAAIVRTIFAQPDKAAAMTQLHKVADGLRTRFSQAAALLEEAAEDILAHRDFPVEHQRQLHSTNPLERLNKEIKRRSAVVGIFPNRAALLRLVGRGAGRAGRRVERGGAALLQRRVDEGADSATRHTGTGGATGGGELRRVTAGLPPPA